MLAKDFYAYFKDCFLLDNSLFQVENLLSQKYSHKNFISGSEELIMHNLPLIPLNVKNVEVLKKELILKKYEHGLFYACFFYLGKSTNAWVKDDRVCAPLLLFPAEIEEKDGVDLLKVNRNEVWLNPFVLSQFKERHTNAKNDFNQEVKKLLLREEFHNDEWYGLINKHFSGVDFKEIMMFPKLWSRRKISSAYKNAEDEFMNSLVPGACVFMANKSLSAINVSHDLDEMIKAGEWSNSLNVLMDNKRGKHDLDLESYSSTRLNYEQRSAIKSAYKYCNSVIIGPPGTGKSYTITNLTLDLLLNDKSVLVVSKTKQSVEVLRNMMMDNFSLKQHMVYTSSPRYMVSLKAKLLRYTSNMLPNYKRNYSPLKIARLLKERKQLEKDFKKEVTREIELSDIHFESNKSWWKSLKAMYLESSLFSGSEINECQKSLDKNRELVNKELISFNRYKLGYLLEKNVSKYRDVLVQFTEAVNENDFTQVKQTMEKIDLEKLLKIFPLWLVNLSELNSVLPQKKDAFDYVIIDEATQCDIASALPAIYRSKHVVVVGDPNQLKHYSFVSNQAQENLRLKYKLPNDKILDYRNRSILDLYISKIEDQEQLSFLKEHFRSTPSIISFSNKHFYDDLLKVIKSTPKHLGEKHLEIEHITGKRDASGVNKKEINRVFDLVRKEMQKAEEVGVERSIGIISPLSSQVKAINKLLKEKFSFDEIKAFNIMCGTPFQFQGSERDVVILSFCVDDNSHHSAFNQVNKAEVFNVAITRAKEYQYVLHSLKEKLRSSDDYLS